MVMVLHKPTNKDFSMDGYLYSNLTKEVLGKAIPHMWDCFVILHGREGAGKTTMATQIAYVLDPNFTVDNIVWTSSQFNQSIDDAEPESSIIWDEAITGAKANQHAEAISQMIISKLTMIRKKKLKIIICFPYLYMLNKYFVSRCLFSIYVYAKGFLDRGYARAYNSRGTELLYNLMKEKYRYNPAGAFKEASFSFKCRFTSMFCADETRYDELKTKYSKLVDDDKGEKYRTLWIKTLTYGLDNKASYSLRGVAKYLGYNHATLSELISKSRKWLDGSSNTNILISQTEEDNVEQDTEESISIVKDIPKVNVKNKEVKVSKKVKAKVNKLVNKLIEYKDDYDEGYNNGILIPDEHLDKIKKRLRSDGRWLNPTE